MILSSNQLIITNPKDNNLPTMILNYSKKSKPLPYPTLKKVIIYNSYLSVSSIRESDKFIISTHNSIRIGRFIYAQNNTTS